MIDLETDKNELQNIADELCIKYNYPKANIKVSKKMKSMWGKCYPIRKSIVLSEEFIKLNSKNVVSDLIKHEICHLKFYPGHGEEFTKACAEMGIKNHTLKQHPKCNRPEHKWEVYCPKCGYTFHFYNKSNRDYRCPICEHPEKLLWCDCTNQKVYIPLRVKKRRSVNESKQKGKN